MYFFAGPVLDLLLVLRVLGASRGLRWAAWHRHCRCYGDYRGACLSSTFRCYPDMPLDGFDRLRLRYLRCSILA